MCVCVFVVCFFFQAEDGIRDLVRSRGLGDVYKRQALSASAVPAQLPLTSAARNVSESLDEPLTGMEGNAEQ